MSRGNGMFRGLESWRRTHALRGLQSVSLGGALEITEKGNRTE